MGDKEISEKNPCFYLEILGLWWKEDFPFQEPVISKHLVRCFIDQPYSMLMNIASLEVDSCNQQQKKAFITKTARRYVFRRQFFKKAVSSHGPLNHKDFGLDWVLVVWKKQTWPHEGTCNEDCFLSCVFLLLSIVFLCVSFKNNMLQYD